MSTVLVKKSLELTDIQETTFCVDKKLGTQSSATKCNTLSIKGKETSKKKATAANNRKNSQDNLQKLELIRKICTVKLDKGTTTSLIQRAATNNPVKIQKHHRKTVKKTAFTEEDFRKFEREY